jgi:hypothetical protein
LIDLYKPVSPPVPLVPGLLAVPESVAVSLSVLPRTHGEAEQVADVVSVGVTGVIVKHSLLPSSSPGWTPASADALSGWK